MGMKLNDLIKNYYYFIAGILAIIFAISHAWNGQDVVLPTLDVAIINEDIRTIFFYVWHIIRAENMLFGLAFIWMSFHKDLSKVQFAAWMIAILMIVRWMVIFGRNLLYNISALKGTLVDSVATAVYVALILMGIRVKG